jgi:hypothetical protein
LMHQSGWIAIIPARAERLCECGQQHQTSAGLQDTSCWQMRPHSCGLMKKLVLPRLYSTAWSADDLPWG